VILASNGLRVWPVDGHATWFDVESASGRDPWRVDLALHGGVGECACEDFQFRKRKQARTGRAPAELARCKHLDAAREVALDLSVARYELDRTGGKVEETE
jgi:hypothetical protein